MQEKPYYHQSERDTLRSWVLSQMLRGAGWAAVLVLGIWLIFMALWVVGEFLPAQSKQMPSVYGTLAIAPPVRTV